MIRFRRAAVALVAAAFALSPLTAANAVSYGVTALPTTDLKSGDTVTVTVSGLTGTQGVYGSVCKGGATAMDIPTPCDTTTEVWITAAGGGGSAAGSATMIVNSTFSTVDCTVDSCVIFIRGDHNNMTDYSLIRAIPLTFVGGGTARIPDNATAKIGSTTLMPNVPGTLRYRTPIQLVVSATSGLPVILTSLTPDCVVSGTKVTALIGNGVCAIGATTAGNATYAPLNVNFPFMVKLGSQKLVVKLGTKKVVIGNPLHLLKSAFRSNFGGVVTLKTTSPRICTVTATETGWTITGKRVGACKLVANAAAQKDKWTAVTQLASLAVSKK